MSTGTNVNTHETPWYLVKNGPRHQSTTDHNHILHLDGRTGEGGGQLLRNAIAYATLMTTTTTQYKHRPALSITHIRAQRSKPGLQAQHVASLQLPVEIMHAAVDKRSTGTSSTSTTVSSSSLLIGDHVGSLEIQYQPPNESSTSSSTREDDETTHDNHSVSSSSPWIVEKDIGTAGSICLLLQASLPCALFASRPPHHHQSSSTILQLNLHGGTNATMAPQYDYWQYVFWPILQHHCQLSPHQIVGTVLRRGYYPRGGGHVQVTVQPLQPHQSLAPIRLTERGTNIQSLYIRAFHAGKLKRHLATQMAQAAQAYLKALGQGEFAFWKDDDDDDDDNNNNLLVDIVTETNAVGNGLGILMVATTDTGCKLAGSALSSPGQKAADVGRAAAKELVNAWKAGGCVDEWLQDQLIIFMALAQGESRMLTGCLTLHTQTAIWTAQQLCPGVHFQVQKLDNDENQEDDDDKDKDRSLAKPASKKQKGASYGQKGLIPGRHLIICQGIGLRPPPR